MADNVIRKFSDLGMSKTVANEYRTEIFGTKVGNAREPGLVDCLMEDEFRERLNCVRRRRTHPNREQLLLL